MKKISIFLGGLIVLITIFVFGVGFFLSPQDQLEHSDVIVVISGGETEERVKEGVELYKNGWAPQLVMSGAARDEGIANAVSMKQIAVSQGVPTGNILIETQATDTIENAIKVKEIIKQEEISRIILVTSPYHQRRASLVFNKVFSDLSVEIINHSAQDSTWRKNGWWQQSWSRYLTLSELQKIIYLLLFSFSY